jgi:hypothetical protein
LSLRYCSRANRPACSIARARTSTIVMCAEQVLLQAYIRTRIRKRVYSLAKVFLVHFFGGRRHVQTHVTKVCATRARHVIAPIRLDYRHLALWTTSNKRVGHFVFNEHPKTRALVFVGSFRCLIARARQMIRKIARPVTVTPFVAACTHRQLAFKHSEFKQRNTRSCSFSSMMAKSQNGQCES